MANKKAIAPLIAAVIIIGFTILIASGVMLWSRGITESALQSAGESQLKLSCVQDIEINVRKSCYTDNQVQVVVENKKGAVNGGFLIKVIGSSSTDVIPASPTSNLDPLEVKTITTFYDPATTGSIEELVIFPKIKSGKDVVTCDTNALNLRIKSC